MPEITKDNENPIQEENHHLNTEVEKVEERTPSEKTKIKLMAKNNRNKRLNSDTVICNPKNRAQMPKKTVLKSLNFKNNALSKAIQIYVERKKKALKEKTGRDLSPIKNKKVINKSKKYGLPKKAEIKKKLQGRKNIKK
ncbi:hypothetical protein CDAR_605891 [Caerostris darwini]|uniref:Uncharacterized protein n=1 Tax=Caerostris darwini TaxID=1538125 RepID=A0AAV4R7S5_9ARAC|nr:hypothetical protein CDAR_605891 [Caerostris darwini]